MDKLFGVCELKRTSKHFIILSTEQIVWSVEVSNTKTPIQLNANACVIEPAKGGGFYEYSSLLCLLVTALSFTTTARSDKFKEFARVGVFSTAITKFN